MCVCVYGDGYDVDNSWLSFPAGPDTDHFRHIWILQRRRRPKAPSFAGAPVPRHRPGEAERAAAIVMSYFHPWTLRAANADDFVPYAGLLRPGSVTWQETLTHWLDGGILCEEAKRYVGNFLSVHRVRPRDDDEDDANSDDVVSDEELELTAADLEEALTSRIGGREKAKGDAPDEEEDEGTHRANSAAGMALADKIWAQRSAAVPAEAVEPGFVTLVLQHVPRVHHGALAQAVLCG